MKEWLSIASLVSAVLAAVIMALDLMVLIAFREHATAWMREQEEINKLLRRRVELLEQDDI